MTGKDEAVERNELKIIDTHVHIVSDDKTAHPIDALGGKPGNWISQRPYNAERLIALQDRLHIAKAVLVQPSSAYGYDNSYMAEVVDAYPGRFVAVGRVDVYSPQAIDDMNYWIEDRGLVGLRLFAIPEQGGTVGHTKPIDDPATFPIWDRAIELGIPMDVQVGTNSLMSVRTLLDRYPESDIILDHLAYVPVAGGPPFDGLVELLSMSSYPNLYLKISHRSLDALSDQDGWSAALMSRLIDAFGANRIMWASNFPVTDLELDGLVSQVLVALDDVFADEQTWVMSKTASTLYPALADELD